MYQHAIIVGFVYRDPTKQYTQAGVLHLRIPLVVKEQWTDNKGQRREKETRYSVLCQGKLAEVIADKVARGQTVLAIGKIDASLEYELEEGERLCLTLRAQEVRVLNGPRPDREPRNNDHQAREAG